MLSFFILIIHWCCMNFISFNLRCLQCLYFSGFIGRGLGFDMKEDLVWYVLFTIFVPFAMLPLPLRWCMLAGFLSAISHIIVTSVRLYVQLGAEVSSLNTFRSIPDVCFYGEGVLVYMKREGG